MGLAVMARFGTRLPASTSAPLVLAGRLEIEVFVRTGRAKLPSMGRRRVPADVVAYFVVPKVANATQYEVSATGFDDPGYYGRGFTMRFAPASATPGRAYPSGFGDTTVRERAGSYWIALSAVSSWADCFASDWAALQARFDGAQITATVTLA